MLIKSYKRWKDLVEGPAHAPIMERREFIQRGLATGALTLGISKALGGDLIKNALADTTTCPAPVRFPGAVGALFANGGPTMGARFFSEAQASVMNAAMAANYGITGTNLVKLAPNVVVDSTSPFGYTLMQGPPGYPGGAAAWQKNVLANVSGGGHLGPFTMDDGAGQDTGLMGAVSPFKESTMGKDIRIANSNALAAWANGTPSASVASATVANLAKTFSLVPASAGFTNSNAMTLASTAANDIATAMAPVTGIQKRKAASVLSTNAGCAFYGNSALADPTYGTTLFTPTNIPALSSMVTLSQLTAAEQAQIAAFYQSASGVAGGVIAEVGGRDYHGTSVQTTITPADIEDARYFVMFLAACAAANAPGAFIYSANGQAIANGTQVATATINGVSVSLNGASAQGDAGGAYNAGLIMFYDPKGAPPAARFTGTVTSTSGNAKADPGVSSPQDAIAGLYMSALQWVNGGTPSASMQAAIQSTGQASVPSNLIVI